MEAFGESKVSPQRDAAEAHHFGGNEEITVLLELEELGSDVFAFGGGDHFGDGEGSGIGDGGQATDGWRALNHGERLEPPCTGACAIEINGVQRV